MLDTNKCAICCNLYFIIKNFPNQFLCNMSYAISLHTIFIIAVTSSLGAANPYFSKAKLHPNCLKVEPTPQLSTEWGLRLFAGARFYIPFGNSQAINHISELVTGDKVSRSGEHKSCTLVRIKGFKLRMESEGDHYLIQDCSVIKKGANQCVANPQSENPEAQEHGNGIFTIVWTDNTETMAVVRCTSDGLYNDWYVFSTRTNLNETVKTTVLRKMKELGFQDSLSDTISPTYQGCELFESEEDD